MISRFLRPFVGLLLFSQAISFSQPAPPNDDFENRITLTESSVTFTGTLQNATIQSGEPPAISPSTSYSFWPYDYYGQIQNASVWWSWTASVSGPVTLDALSFSSNVFKLGAIDVWTGTSLPSGSNFVAGIALDIGRHPFLTFSATAGTPYQIRVVGTNYGEFTLSITETNWPIIFIQPFSRTVVTNESVFFGVVAAGNPPFATPFSYQWRSNGVDIPGETFPIFSMDNLSTNQSGAYSVMVSNAVGGTLSDTANLNVTEANTPPQLTADGFANGQFSFGILGELGKLYRIQSSTNLANWNEEKSFPIEFIYYNSSSYRSRNGVVYGRQDSFPIPPSASQKFYRTTNYAPPLAACINNLAAIRFAKEIRSHEHKITGNSVPAPSELSQYFRNGGPACPAGGPAGTFQSTYTVNRNSMNPTCKIVGSHILEEPEY